SLDGHSRMLSTAVTVGATVATCLLRAGDQLFVEVPTALTPSAQAVRAPQQSRAQTSERQGKVVRQALAEKGPALDPLRIGPGDPLPLLERVRDPGVCLEGVDHEPGVAQTECDAEAQRSG